jgi:uncharacterized protein
LYKIGQYEKPLPKVRPETEPFWRAARNHQLVLQRCDNCSKIIFYPRVACPNCLSSNISWFEASGRGTVYSYTIIWRAAAKVFEKDIPYVYAIIELEEGARMISNIINMKGSKPTIGMKVKVTFIDATSEISIPQFEPY